MMLLRDKQGKGAEKDAVVVFYCCRLGRCEQCMRYKESAHCCLGEVEDEDEDDE